MAVDDIQNSEKLLDLSKQILDSLNQRAASQQKLNSDEKAYAAALEKSQKISNAIVSNQIKSKDLTKAIINAEENLNQIKQKFNNLEKTAQTNRGKALTESRKLRQQERDTTQEITKLTQQNLRLELDKQSLLQETAGLSFTQIQTNQELASQLETQIASNQEAIILKSTQLDLTRQSAQKEEAIAAIEKDKIKSGREVIRLKKQEIENLNTAYDLYTENKNQLKLINTEEEKYKNLQKSISNTEKSRQNTLSKLATFSQNQQDASQKLADITSKQIDDAEKLKELGKEKASFEKTFNSLEKEATSARKKAILEEKKSRQELRSIEKDIQGLLISNNTLENIKQGLIRAGKNNVAKKYEQEINSNNTLLKIKEDQANLLKTEIQEQSNINKASKDLIKNSNETLQNFKDQFQLLKNSVEETNKFNNLTKKVTESTDQQLQLQSSIQDKVNQQLTYKEKDKILTQGITELQAKQDKAKQAADTSQLQTSSKIESLTKSILDLDNKKVTIDREIAKLGYEIYKLEQAKTAEQAKQNADSKVISDLQKKIDANNKLVASKVKQNDLIDKELKTLNDSKSATEILATKVNDANQTNLDKQKLITDELGKQVINYDRGIQSSKNLVKESDNIVASIDKRKAIIGSISTLEHKVYDIATKQKDISNDIIANQQEYKNNQVDSKKISETIAAAEGTILTNIKDIASLETELASRRQAAFSTIYSSRQKQKDLEQEIIKLNQTQLALEGTRQGQLRLGNTDLADQAQQTINLNKATIQNYKDEISKLGDIIKTRKDVIVSIAATKTSLKGIIENSEKELVFLEKNLETRKKIEILNAREAEKAKNQADNLAAIQNSENLLDLANDSLNSINERKKLLKGISAEEQLYAATVRQQQKVSQDITANSEKYLGFQIKSKDLDKQILAVKDNQNKSAAAFKNIEGKITKEYQDALKANSRLLETIDKETVLNNSLSNELDRRVKKYNDLKTLKERGNNVSATELKLAYLSQKAAADKVRESNRVIKNLEAEQQKQEGIAKTAAGVIKNGKEVLKSQAKELAFLEKSLQIRKRIERSTGLLGGMAKAASKLPGIGQYLKADEAVDEMEKLAAEIERNGGKATSFGNRMKIAAKGLEVLVKGAYENLKSPEAIFTFLLKSALTANDQAVKLGKSLGYAGERANAYRETLVGIERSSKNTNVNVANLVEAFGELSRVTGFAYEFTADQLETQIKLTKQVGLTAEEAAQVQRFGVLNKKTSEETYRSFVRGLAVTRNQLRVGIDFKASLAEAVKVSGQLAANLGNNPETIAKAVVTAQAFGMTLDQVAKAGDSLLNFESSISNELQAELLTGKELNLERARAAALAGDQIALAEELTKNIGTAAEFTKMNRLQQNALAQAVGMTADELANTLRKREEALASGKSLAQINEEEAAQALERQSIQDKFNAAIMKLQSLIGNLVAGPLGGFLDILSNILNVVNYIGNAFSFLATPLKIVGFAFAGIYGTMLLINGVGKAIAATEGLMVTLTGKKAANQSVSLTTRIAENTATTIGNAQAAVSLATEQGKLSFKQLGLALENETLATRTAAYFISLKDLVIERSKNIAKAAGNLLGKKDLFTSIGTAVMNAVSSVFKGPTGFLGPFAIPIALAAGGIIGALGATYMMSDGELDPSGAPILFGSKGAVKLDPEDKLMYGADGNVKVGTNLMETEDGIQASVLKKSSAQASIANTNAQLIESINNLRQDTVRTNNEIREATLASATKPAIIDGEAAFNRRIFSFANQTATKFA